MTNKIPSVEKVILGIALSGCAITLGLVGYAALRLGISVPTCVTNVTPFTEGQFITHSPSRYEVHMLAKMWAFEPNVIQVPAGSTVDFYITSKDVTHGFYIDKTNVNLMSVPNVVNYAQAKFTKPGKYSILCHEYCGTAHHAMFGMVEVLSSDAKGVALGLPQAAGVGETPIVLAGRKLFADKGCMACHSTDGSPMSGPTFKNFWGHHREFTDGGTLEKVDDAYIMESIATPQKHVVKGFGPVMPQLPISKEEMEAILAYIKTL